MLCPIWAVTIAPQGFGHYFVQVHDCFFFRIFTSQAFMQLDFLEYTFEKHMKEDIPSSLKCNATRANNLALHS